jgi:hypothetical protein
MVPKSVPSFGLLVVVDALRLPVTFDGTAVGFPISCCQDDSALGLLRFNVAFIRNSAQLLSNSMWPRQSQISSNVFDTVMFNEMNVQGNVTIAANGSVDNELKDQGLINEKVDTITIHQSILETDSHEITKKDWCVINFPKLPAIWWDLHDQPCNQVCLGIAINCSSCDSSLLRRPA